MDNTMARELLEELENDCNRLFSSDARVAHGDDMTEMWEGVDCDVRLDCQQDLLAAYEALESIYVSPSLKRKIREYIKIFKEEFNLTID